MTRVFKGTRVPDGPSGHLQHSGALEQSGRRTLPAMDATTTVLESPPNGVDEVDDAELVEEELLVEEISIDGMCGVY